MKSILNLYRILEIVLAAFLATSNLSLYAQMGGQGGMGGGMGSGTMGGLISGRNAGNTAQGGNARAQVVSMPGWGMMMSWDDREGMAMGMSAGPYIQGDTVYTLLPDVADLSSGTANFNLLWKLSAYDLNGKKLWDVKLEGDMLSVPEFAPDGKILLTGREGMVGMNGGPGSQYGGGNPNAVRPFSSTLYLITPNSTGAEVVDIKLDGEWSSRPVPVISGNSYLIYLTAKTVDLSDWNPLPRPMSSPSQDSPSHQFLHAFDSNGNQKLKAELR